jgi:hypothetical protein
LVLLALVAVAGCGRGPTRAPVEGQVLYEGKPLEFGTVMFQPPSGQPSQARIRPDGTFTMETFGHGAGAIVGRCRVRITCYESDAPSADGAMSEEPVTGRMLIPSRYGEYATSGLEVDVLPGKNEPTVFELTK